MKKLVLTIALACTIFMYSCIGSFGLTNKCYDWNNSIGDKWINELVFIGLSILPVYEICVVADAVVFNSIEFWTGNNPIAYKAEIINTDNGQYLVETTKNGYTISNGDAIVRFVNDNDVWYLNQDTLKVELFHFVDENHILMNLGDKNKLIELSQNGIDDLCEELER